MGFVNCCVMRDDDAWTDENESDKVTGKGRAD